MPASKTTCLAIALLSIAVATTAATPRHSSKPSSSKRPQTALQSEVEQKKTETASTGVSPNLEAEFAAEDHALDSSRGEIADPLIGWNKMWYHFNDKTYFWVLKPVSTGYGKVMPKIARAGLRNALINLKAPVRIINCALQGRFSESGQEVERFGINSTLGVLGFMDTATTKFKMNYYPRDGDQTLAKTGAGTGIYLVWPFIGPSSVRGTGGWLIDTVTSPLTYLPGAPLVDNINNTSLDPGTYEKVKEASVDPYVAMRNGYVQYRQKRAGE